MLLAEIMRMDRGITMAKALCLIAGTMLFIGMTFLLVVVVSGCTYSINNVQTEGKASDVVDETDNVEPNISPNIELPLNI